MRSRLRWLVFSALGLVHVACYSSKTTNVEPGATSVQPVECLSIGETCHSSADCCTHACSGGNCSP